MRTPSPWRKELPAARRRDGEAENPYERRGAVVPFTTPDLPLARVRSDERHHLVLLVAGFGGAESSYVLPWEAVPELVRLTPFDRALHDEIGRRGAVTPDALRACALQAARLGFSGVEAARAARALMDEEDTRVREIQLRLLVAMLKANGVSVVPLIEAGLSAEAGRAKARDLLSSIASRIDPSFDGKALYAHLEAVATLLEPVGLPGAATPGRLRRCAHRIERFHLDLREWAFNTSSEMGLLVPAIGGNAECTARIADAILTRLDLSLDAPHEIVRDWPRESARLIKLCNRLTWLLDGWEALLDLWDQSANRDNDMHAVLLPTLLVMLPRVPKEDLDQAKLAPPSVENALNILRKLMPNWRRLSTAATLAAAG